MEPPPAAAALIGRSRPVLKTEKPTGDGDCIGDGDSPASKQHLLLKMGNYHGKKEHETEDKTSSSSDQKDLTCTKLQEDELECARAEIGEVRGENERLKMSLSRMMKDYEALRMQFMGIVRQDDGKKSTTTGGDDMSKNVVEKQMEAETELVSLTLGRFPAAAEEKDEKKMTVKKQEQGVKAERLSLGLSYKFEELHDDHAAESTAKLELVGNINNSPKRSPTNSSEEGGETTWPPSKGLKTARTSGDDNNNDNATTHNPPKRARVCVRARCDTATMNDGCQWRKYGQKIAKGNPCPRAYYRCTGSPTCPVRKQVQRCADDMSILITTYEGNHNHPLPVSATAMASTTSAAASMLLSGSTTSSATNLHALNFHNNSNSKHFYLPNGPSISSTSPTHPTITLDLTSNPSSSAANNNPQSHFSKFAPSFANSRYPFTSQLDFGSSRNNVLSWSNGLLSYANQGGYSTNRINNNSNNSTAAHNVYHNYIQRSNSVGSSPAPPHQPDTIAAATKAITADPSFQSALAAALTSIIGNGGGAGLVKSSSSAARSGDHQYQPAFQLSSSAAKGNNACGTSFLSNIAAAGTAAGAPSSSPQAGNLVFVPASSSLPFSNPKSASASPGDHVDLTN